MRKRLLTILLAISMILIIPAAVFAEGEGSAVAAGWNADRTQYTLDDGTLAKGLFKAKMKDDVGALFYADDNGNVVKTPGTIVTVPADRTRFLRSQDAEGHWGFREVGAIDKNSYSYLIGENGEGAIVETAKSYNTSAGTVVVQENGTVLMAKGFADINGVRYYVGDGGIVRTKVGWIRVDGKKYRIESGGVVRTKVGAFKVGSDRYVIPTGSDGAIATKKGVATANSKLYYVKTANGKLGTYKVYKIGNKTYHVNKTGVIRVGRHKWKDKKYYYSTSKGFLKTKAGMITHEGKRFHVNKGGLVTVNKKFKYKKRYYIADKTGVIYKGLFTWRGVKYYSDSKGALLNKAGMIEVDGKDYFVGANGVVYTNRLFKWNGKLYAADKNGYLQSGIISLDGKYYYADTDHVIRTSEGIVKENNKYYFVKKGGPLAKNEWVDYNSKHYYAGSDAAFKTAAFTKSGVTFHPASNGEISNDEYKKLFPDPSEDEGNNADDVD